MTETSTFTPEAIARAWQDALDLWGIHVTLSPPEPLTSGKHYAGEDPLAYIDLSTRQVAVNFEKLAEVGAASSLTAVLAHEIGHHVRHPHTLLLAAELQTLEKRLVPFLSQSLTNLFFDLLVNEVVGLTRAQELCAVYRGFLAESKAPPDPLFAFYLAIYEELWGLAEGDLLPAAVASSMEEKYPGFRADARLFAQTFYSEDDVYLQFLYFCGRFIRYLPDPSKADHRIALGHDVPTPAEDDYERAGYGNDQIERAIDEAARRGWIHEKERKRLLDEEGLDAVKRVTHHTPGHGVRDFVYSEAADRYRQLVEKYLIEPPPTELPPEPALPTVTEDWDPGDGLHAIDWGASIRRAGPLAAAFPLKRDREPDESPSLEGGLPAMEIYLDTSGSMPDPKTQVNAMTLAAQVLSASVIRKGGVVRGIIYSSDWRLSDWMYNEDVARQFFLLYSGGGTAFPFPLLRHLARERHDVIRVVISDSDFLCNVGVDAQEPVTAAGKRAFKGPKPAAALDYGIHRSRLFVAMLALPHQGSEDWLKAALGPVVRHPNFRLVRVAELSDLARAAADLARAILG